jgi:predicted aminopeptidase
LFLAGLSVCVQGCYFLSQYAGQMAILSKARPVEEVLAEETLTPKDRDTIRLIQEIKKYAEERIGLKQTQNFTTFYPAGDKPVSWSVTGCRKDRFEPHRWHYPIIGAASYKGFFDPESALREAVCVEEKGYETLVVPVTAYSTLGYFKDPIYSRGIRPPTWRT